MDADQLRALLLGQMKANAVLQAVNAELQVVVKYKDAVISKITLELALHKRFRFSKKAESLTAEQRHLFDETLDGDTAQIEQEELNKLPEQDKEVVTRSLKPKRKPLPPELATAWLSLRQKIV